MQILCALDPQQRTLQRICDELWDRFGIKYHQTTLSKRLNKWDLWRKAEEATRIEAKKAVAAAVAEADLGTLRTQIASLNRLEDLALAVLNRVLPAVEDASMALTPVQVLQFGELAAKLIIAGADARKRMADSVGIPDAQVTEAAVPAGGNIIDYAEAQARFAPFAAKKVA